MISNISDQNVFYSYKEIVNHEAKIFSILCGGSIQLVLDFFFAS